MAFNKEKADKLKDSASKLDSIKKSVDEEIISFEKMLKEDVGENDFYLVIDKLAPDAEGLSFYSEFAWCFFQGPLPMEYEAGWHFVVREFKVKEEDYGNESKYIDPVASKVLCSSTKVKELAISKFDLFLDGFQSNLDSKLSK